MTAQASPRGPLKERITVAAMAAWLVVTVVSQHPDRGFDKLRKADPTGLLIPNWRFFAPEPAVDDTHLLYRFHSPETGEYSQWYSANQAQQRKLVHAFWFPGRREEKAVFDVTAGLLSNVNSGISASETRQLSAFSLLSNYVRVKTGSTRRGPGQLGEFQMSGPAIVESYLTLVTDSRFRATWFLYMFSSLQSKFVYSSNWS